MKSASDYKRDSALVPSTAIKLHRVKRGGLLGVMGKPLRIIGPVYPKLCFVPPLGTALCPVVKKLGSAATKVGLASKKYAPTVTKILIKAFPKFIFKDLKSVLTANPVTATKNISKYYPRRLKYSVRVSRYSMYLVDGMFP